jgi:hypothetical protein
VRDLPWKASLPTANAKEEGLMNKEHDGPTHPAKGTRPPAWNVHWSLIPRKEVEAIHQQLTQAAGLDGARYEQMGDVLDVPACIEFPLGELLNPAMEGYLWVWELTRRFSRPYAMEQSKSSFSAQGIEGLIRAEEVSLTVALRAAEEMDPYRVALSIRQPWLQFARTLTRRGVFAAPIGKGDRVERGG